jgi:hypothetical protein
MRERFALSKHIQTWESLEKISSASCCSISHSDPGTHQTLEYEMATEKAQPATEQPLSPHTTKSSNSEVIVTPSSRQEKSSRDTSTDKPLAEMTFEELEIALHKAHSAAKKQVWDAEDSSYETMLALLAVYGIQEVHSLGFVSNRPRSTSACSFTV